MENAMIDKLYPLGLALGGGGARGFAHLGVAQGRRKGICAFGRSTGPV